MNTITMKVVIVAVILVAHYVDAEIDKQKMMEIGKKCMEESNTSEDEVKAIMNKELPQTKEGKCMMACIFKSTGIMTADGKFNEQAHNEMMEKALSDNPEKLEKAKGFADSCRDQINSVQDNESGCERAAEMHKCAVEAAKQLGDDD